MHFLPLVVVLVFSFCASYVVCPVNHTSQKIIVSWYRLNFISLLSQEMQFICISTSIFKCNLFFWICLDICICFTTVQFLVCLVAKRKIVSCCYITFFGDVLQFFSLYAPFLLFVCAGCSCKMLCFVSLCT